MDSWITSRPCRYICSDLLVVYFVNKVINVYKYVLENKISLNYGNYDNG